MATYRIYSSQATIQNLGNGMVQLANNNAKAAFWAGIQPLPPAAQGITINANDLLNMISNNTLEIVASRLKNRLFTDLIHTFKNSVYPLNPIVVNIAQLVATAGGNNHVFIFRIHSNIINTITLNYTKDLKIELGLDNTGEISLYLSSVVPPTNYVYAMNGAFPQNYAAYLGRTNPSGGVKIP
jgi:hypothetical protein